MIRPSTRRWYSYVILLWLTLFLALEGCSKAGQAPSLTNQKYTSPVGGETVCLDRLLIDAPASVEMGATEVRFDGAYGFAGIENVVGGGELRWGRIPVLETVPTDVAGYNKIHEAARAKVASPQSYKAGFRALEEKIDIWSNRVKSGTPEESAFLQQFVDDAKRELDLSHYSFKVSGEAKLIEENRFAIRRGSHFFIGYLHPIDRRVRTFEGELSNPQLATPGAAAEEFRRFERIYHSRLPTEIPTTPGYCTSFGFIDEPDHPEMDIEMKLPFRIRKYPNLIFILTIEPADPDGPRDIQKLPRMDADNAKLDLIGIKGSYGPIRETILGTPGRSYGQEYGPNCSATSCRPADQAYDIEAETFGVPGRADQPHLILHMKAATSDDYKLEYPEIPGDPTFNKPGRPALSGHVPPPFKEGQQIFEQVLRSIRLRPNAIATPPMSASAPAQLSQPQQK